MTRFEENGVAIQYATKNIPQATHCFKNSCNLCCNRGFRIDCDRCAISYAHSHQVEILEAEAIHVSINVIAVSSRAVAAIG